MVILSYNVTAKQNTYEKKNLLFISHAFFVPHSLTAQSKIAKTENHQKVQNLFSDFFMLDRENIHAHFDKSIFSH